MHTEKENNGMKLCERPTGGLVSDLTITRGDAENEYHIAGQSGTTLLTV